MTTATQKHTYSYLLSTGRQDSSYSGSDARCKQQHRNTSIFPTLSLLLNTASFNALGKKGVNCEQEYVYLYVFALKSLRQVCFSQNTVYSIVINALLQHGLRSRQMAEKGKGEGEYDSLSVHIRDFIKSANRRLHLQTPTLKHFEQTTTTCWGNGNQETADTFTMEAHVCVKPSTRVERRVERETIKHHIRNKRHIAHPLL